MEHIIAIICSKKKKKVKKSRGELPERIHPHHNQLNDTVQEVCML